MCTSVLAQLCCHELPISVPEALEGGGKKREKRFELEPKMGF